MTTVRSVLAHYGIEYEEVPYSKSDLFYYCPFHKHSDDKMGSSRFDEDQEIFNCFACGVGGNIYQFVAKMESCSVGIAKRLIENDFHDLSSFDIDALKRVLDRKFEVMAKDTSRIDQEIVERMLSCIIKEQPPISVVFSWYPVFAHITNSNLSQKALVDIYGEFLQEINNKSSNN